MSNRAKREFFDQEAWGWDDRCHRDDEAENQRLVDSFDLKPGEWVLDLGTGSGVLLPHLLRKVKGRGRVVGVDFSWNMIREATKAAKRESLCLVNASVEALPIKGQTFDCITCLDTFAHVDGQREALSEMSRVLKRGGRLHLVHSLGRTQLADRHREVGGVVRHDVLPPDSSMKLMMEKAGLTDIRIIDCPDLYLASAKK